MKSKLHDSLSLMLYLGIGADYGELSLCNLANISITRGILDRRYQVHCDDSRFRFSQIYSNPQTAVDKFVLIFNFLKSKENKD